MTAKEAVNWLINLTADIGKSEHHTLWHYEQALEIKEMLEGKDTNVPSKDTIYRQDAINAAKAHWYKPDIVGAIEQLPSAQQERVWTPCDIPPEHHRDVIVRGIETIGNVAVYKIMQWDVDRWRPENYAPSIILLDWSEI